MLFTLASKVRPGDSVYLGASPQTSYVLAVSPAADNKVRIVTDAGSALLGPGQHIRVG